MSNSDRNLTPFANEQLELLIDTNTGESFASISAIARMMSTPERNCSPKQVSSYCETLLKSLKVTPPFEAEIQTAVGIRSLKLYSEKAIRECAKKYNPDLFDTLADVGIRVYLHKLAGYQVTSTATQKPLSRAEILIQQGQMMLEVEQRQAEHNLRLEAIEQLQVEARKQMNLLPAATVEVEPLTTRFALGRLLRGYAIANNIPHQETWNQLYLEHRDRTHIDLKTRAKNHKPKMSGCEYAEKYGYIEQLYAIAQELFGSPVAA